MPQNAARGRTAPGKVSIQVALSAVGVGLVLFTSILIGMTLFFNTRAIVEDLSDQVFSGAFREITLVTEEKLGGIDEVLGLNRSLMVEGLIGPNELAALGEHFVQVLRSHPYLTEVGYGDNQGRAVWAERSTAGGSVTRCEVVPGIGQSPSVQKAWKYGESGDPVSSETTETDYDPRTRPWYRIGAASDNPAWTPPYVFTSGVPGLSRTWRLTDENGEVAGVFDISFELDFISLYLADAVEEFPGELFLLNLKDEGQVIAHSDPSRIIQKAETNSEIPTISKLGDPRLLALQQQIESQNTGAWNEGQWSGEVKVDGELWIAFTEPLSTQPELGWSMVLLIPESSIMGPVRRSNRIAFIVACGAMLVGVLTAFILARRISHRLSSLSSEIEDVGQLVLSERAPHDSIIREVNVLEHSVHAMKIGLRSFRRFVPTELVRSLLEKGTEAKLGGKRQEVTLLFTDIIGYTSICEKLEPETLVAELGNYLEEMTNVIEDNEGTVNQYVGDAIMAIFGAPSPVENHPLKACRAALAFRRKNDELAEWAERENHPVFRSRISINTGEAIVGNLGSKSRLYFTANGDEVNLASRLESINGYYGTGIALSQATFELVQGSMTCRKLDIVAVKGRSAGEPIYELVGEAGKVETDDLEFIKAYESALACYLGRQWKEAIERFTLCLEKRKGDRPSELLIEKCQHFSSSPPPDNWDGTTEMKEK